MTLLAWNCQGSGGSLNSSKMIHLARLLASIKTQVDIKVAPGSLANEESVNKQLNDKERVAAALENPNLRQLVDECLCFNDPYSR